MKATNDRVSSVTEYREGLENLFSFSVLFFAVGWGHWHWCIDTGTYNSIHGRNYVKTVQILTEACRYDREGLDMAFIR